MIRAFLLILAFASLWMIPAKAAESEAKDIVSLTLENYVGNDRKSLNGSYGYHLAMKGNSGSGAFRGVLGGGFFYAPGEVKYSSTSKKSATLYSGEFSAGFILIPMGDEGISPYLEFTGSLGTAFLQISSPPTGVDAQSVALTYGGQIGFGVQVPFGGSRLRLHAAYVMRTATKLASESGFGLNAMAFGASLGF